MLQMVPGQSTSPEEAWWHSDPAGCAELDMSMGQSTAELIMLHSLQVHILDPNLSMQDCSGVLETILKTHKQRPGSLSAQCPEVVL